MKTAFKSEWFKQQFKSIRLVKSKEEISDEELKELLLNIYEEREIYQGYLYNNVDDKTTPLTIEEFINAILGLDYIVTGYGVLHENQYEGMNIGAEALKFLLDARKVFKKRMFEALSAGDMEGYILNYLLQLTYKVLANSYYGCIAMLKSHFYNSYVQNSITATGRLTIQTSALAFESYLSDNVKFDTVSEMLLFISRVKDQEYKHDIMGYTLPKTKTEVYDKFMNNIYQELDGSNLEKALSNLSQEELNKVYFKNNFKELVKEPYFIDKIKSLLDAPCDLEESEASLKYVWSDEFKEIQDSFNELSLEFTLYNYLYDNRVRRIEQDMRKSVLAIDTDSNFLYLDPIYQTIKNKFEIEDDVTKYKTLNILIELLEKVVIDVYENMTETMGIPEEYRSIINMKSEYIFSRMIFTDSKKNYAGVLVGQEGSLYKKPKLAITGLPIKKVSVPKKLKPLFSSLLKEDILEAEEIDISKIIENIDKISETIQESLHKGSLEFALPKSVKPPGEYKHPDRIMGLRGAVNWNELYPENPIMLPDKVNVIKLDCKKYDDDRLQKIKEEDLDLYLKIIKGIFECEYDIYPNVATLPVVDNRSKFALKGLTTISIPQDVAELPKWLIPFIDVKDMVSTHMAAASSIFKGIGLVQYGTKAKIAKSTRIINF